MRSTLQNLFDAVMMGRHVGANARADLTRYAGGEGWTPEERELLEYLKAASTAVDRVHESGDDLAGVKADLAGHMLAESMNNPALFLDLVEEGCGVARDSIQMGAGLGHIGPTSYELATWGAVAKATAMVTK
jgi:hypothetical protein